MLGRFISRPYAQVCALAATFLLTFACRSGGGSGQAFDFEKIYTGSYSVSGLSAAAVNFTLSWNESNGLATGMYQDNFFAPNGQRLSGTASDELKTFRVPFSAPVQGVQTLVFTLASSEKGLIAMVQGLGPSGATVFAASNVPLESAGGGTGGNAKPEDEEGFFAQIAGSHEWVASRTGANDDTWTAGKTYKAVITRGGRVTLSTDAGTVEFTYGEPDDKFAATENEAHVIAVRETCAFLLQHQFASNEKFLSCSMGDPATGASWMFRSPVTSTRTKGALAALGAGDAVGEFTATFTKLEGEGTIYHQQGSDVTFRISAEGDLQWQFSQFPYADDTFQLSIAAIDGVQEHHLYWYYPNKSIAEKTVHLVLRNGVFTSIAYVSVSDGKTRYHYAELKK